MFSFFRLFCGKLLWGFAILFVISCNDSEISKTPIASGSNSDNSTPTQTGSFSGTAIDVFTGDPLANTWLCLEDGTTCTQTDGDGNYTFNDVPYGEHTITPYDGDGGDILKYDSDGDGIDPDDPNYQGFTFTLDENTPTTGFQISTGDETKLSGSMTIITTWKDLDGGGINDQDIDVHLIIPLGGACSVPNDTDSRYFEDASSNPYTILDWQSIISGSSPFAFESSPFATLDLDDVGRDSNDHTFHMETLKINLNGDGTTKCSGTYHFYLNNFNTTTEGTTNFKDLEAQVRVLIDGSVAADFVANDNGGNKYWGVFNINSDGTITSINSLDSNNEYNDDCEDLYPEINGSGKCADAKH